MRSILRNPLLIGCVIHLLFFEFVSATPLPRLPMRPCFEDKKFGEALMALAAKSPTSSVYDKLLYIQSHTLYFSDQAEICRVLAGRMNSLRDDFYSLFDKRSVERTGRLTMEQYEGLVSGYLVASSGHIRGPNSGSLKGMGKLKTMSVVDYVVTGDEAEMSRLLSGGEIRLVETLLRFFTGFLESQSLGGGGSREEAPTTPTFRSLRSGASAASPHRYLPGNDQWYELLFGVISNLITWEDAELIDLYRSVVETLLSVDFDDPSSRSSIYRSLMFVNQQLYLDRTIGLASNDPNDTVGRIRTYKRILSRLIPEEDGQPFVFSFEQLELIALYESFVKSAEYASSTDFVYKDSLKRSLLLNGVLFSLEFDSARSLIVNIVGSVLKDLVAVFPSQETLVSGVFIRIMREVNLMRTRESEDIERVENDMLRILGGMPWTTPADIGYVNLNAEFCAGLDSHRFTASCETMRSLLERQMEADEYGRILKAQQLMLPLQKVNKSILYRIRNSDRGTEDMINALESVWGEITEKLEGSEAADLSDEKWFLERLLESPAVVVTQPTPAESQPLSPSRNQKGKKKGRGRGRKGKF